MLDAGPDQGNWNDEPEEVHHEVVHPEVEELWARVDDALVVVVEHAGGVIKNDAVKLAGGDNDLDWVAEWVTGSDHGSDNKAQRSPCELGSKSVWLLQRKVEEYVVGRETYSSDSLHAENEWIRGEVSGIGECVLLPQLTEEVLLWSHSLVVDGEVSLEEQVNASSYYDY